VIAEFEQRLADVLGTRLPAPLGGHVSAAPGTGAPGPAVLVGVRRFDRIDEGFGDRPELVPGATDPRRVARLRCQVALTLAGVSDRAAAVRGVDAVIYAVDAPDFRDGGALRVANGDPGFLIDALALVGGDVADGATPAAVSVVAEGWFWPVGTPGGTGVVIGEIRVRGVALPIELTRARPTLAAGEPAMALTLRVRAAGLLRLGVPATLPFGQLALQLLAAGSKPGAGALTGGTTGTGGNRLVPLTDGVATFAYVPPATAAIDELVVSLDDGNGGAGVELGRFALLVKDA
jgi:hypothetical protein